LKKKVTSPPDLIKDLQDYGVIMDIKNRVKAVKEKLKDLGYEVKHTHCQEVLAVAHGERNFHTLKAKEEGPSNLTKALEVILPTKNKEFVMAMSCSSTREEYEEECRAVLVSITPKDYERILKGYELITSGVVDDFGISLEADSLKVVNTLLRSEEVYDTDFVWIKTDHHEYTIEENDESCAQFRININHSGLWIMGESDAYKDIRLNFDSNGCISINDLKEL
jgi:hypothetical protein